MPRCLIIDKMHPSIKEELEGIGYSVDYRPDIRREEIISILIEYQGLIVRSKTAINSELLQSAHQLKWVGRAGAGIDQLDVEELENRNITVLNAPEGNQDALAEHTIGLILGVLSKFQKGNNQIRNNIWDREGNRGEELGSMTVGVIGYGYMGKAVCKRLSAFGCKILVYDKYLTGFGNEEIQEATLDQLFEFSDLLTLHIPLTEETRRMVDSPFIDNFHKPIYFINTARGEIASLEAVNRALSSGKIKGTGLDVLENEKLELHSEKEREEFNKLKTFDNVLLTPHVGGWSFESFKRINDVLIQKIKALDEK